MQKERIIYLDILKIVAILFVIFNHSHWYINSGGTLGNGLHHFLFYFCKIAVPLFLMVSGALVLKKDLSYKEIFSKRIYRILVPLFLVLIINYFIHYISLKDFVYILFTDYSYANYPYWLWYLYLLIALYLVTPFLQRMLKNFTKNDYKVFILLFVFVGSFCNGFLAFSSLFIGEEMKFNEAFLAGFFTVPIGYYVLGYYLSNVEISKKNFKVSIFVLVLSLVFGTLFLRYGYMRGFSYDEIIKYSDFLVALPAIATFIIFKYLFEKPFKSKKISKLIVNISGSVFGVYLVHVYLIEFFIKTNFVNNIRNFNSLIGVLCMDLIVFIVLVVIVYFVKKIPYIKQFL